MAVIASTDGLRFGKFIRINPLILARQIIVHISRIYLAAAQGCATFYRALLKPNCSWRAMLASKVTKAQLLKAHAVRFECEHKQTLLRTRTVSGGGLQRVFQCLQCGEPTSSPIAKEKALEMCGGTEPPPFDNDLKEKWSTARKAGFESIFKDDRIEFWESYDKYLLSPEWANKRQLVFARAQHICEGCRLHVAEHVHHTSYEHVGAEFLFELVAVCASCHERLHAFSEVAL